MRRIWGSRERPDGVDREPDVLELRVHGINNTPPAQMLEVAPEDVERARGDTLGGFWVPTEASRTDAAARAARLWDATPAHGHGRPRPTPADWVPPDWVPPGVRREAYSWGATARYSPASPGGLAAGVVTRISRAAWLAVLPLGIANAAYWARRLVPDSAGGERRYGRGYAGTRLFGLGLTLLLVASVQVVALDLLATRCLEQPARCATLPTWLAGLGAFTWTQRLAAMSLLPLAVLVLLQWLATRASVRYEMPAAAAADGAPVPGAEVAILAQPDLWSRWRLTHLMAHAHVSAGTALVVLTLVTSRLWAGTGCASGPGPLEAGCLAAAGARPWLSAAAVTAASCLVASVVQVGWAHLWAPRAARAAGPAPSGGMHRVSLTFSRLVLTVTLLLHLAVGSALWFDTDQPAAPAVQGMAAVPAVLVVTLLLGALVAFTWRQRAWLTALSWALAAAVVAALLWAGEDPGAGPAVLGGAALLAAAALPVLGRTPGRLGLRDVRREAWWGAGPGVFLVVALGLQLMLCTLVAVAAGDWLNGAAPAQCLVLADADVVPGATSCPAAALPLPRTFLLFAATTVLALVISLVFLGVVVGRWFRRTRSDDAVTQPFPDVRRPAGVLREVAGRPELATALRRARDRADLAQRAESGLGALAAALALTLAFTVLRLPQQGWLSVAVGPVLGPVTSVGVWAIGLAWTAALARAVFADGTGARPLGLLWDLIGFLPRSAHPFGPPCYAERAVPEIVGRTDAWLTGADLPAGSPIVARRRVVLSAHSMGAVLAAAALMVEPGRAARRTRVALLTYGTQLRPYFGRFFPELFGPDVLGTASCGYVGFDRRSWDERTVPEPTRAGSRRPSAGVAPRLVDLLGRADGAVAWTSLWRRTDPLGMAAGDPRVDVEAEEIDASGYVAEVATHGGYPRTLAYQWALADLVARLRPGAPDR